MPASPLPANGAAMAGHEVADEGIQLERLDLDAIKAATDLGTADFNDKRSVTPGDSLPPTQPPTRPASIKSESDAPLDEREAAADALPPIDGGIRAWTFLAAASLLEMLVWGLGNASGTFQDYHLSSPQSPLYGKPSSISAATGTLSLAGQYFAPFLFLGYLSAFPSHVFRFSVIALLCSVLGYVAASLHPTPATVVILQGLVAGLAGGAFWAPAMLWLPQWFSARIGLASGVIFLGSGAGGIIWPFAVSALLSRVGFSWTLRCLALVQGVVGIAIICMMRPRIKPQRDSHTLRTRRNIWRAVLPVHDKMVYTPLGMANSALQFLQGAAFYSVAYYLSPYATSLGLSRTTSTALLATLNAASASSYIVTGRLCDAVPYAPMIIVIGGIGSILVGILLGLAKSAPALFIFAILYGFFNGGFPCIMSATARELAILGQTEHSAIFVEIMAFRGLGSVAGPLISSLLYKNKRTGSSQGPWSASAVYGSHGIGSVVIFCTICTVLASVAATSTLPMKRLRQLGHAM